MKGSSDRPTSLHAKLKELAQIWAIDLSFVGRRLWNKLGPPIQQRDSELTLLESADIKLLIRGPPRLVTCLLGVLEIRTYSRTV